MSQSSLDASSHPEDAPTKKEELRAFLCLTVVLAPVLAVIIVGGYGFLIWMSHIIVGPPGS